MSDIEKLCAELKALARHEHDDHDVVMDAVDELGCMETALVIAFVQGAQWWEFHNSTFTMWPSDRDKAEAEALKRLEKKTLGMRRP